jgi:CRISPR-associated endonuclease Cas1
MAHESRLRMRAQATAARGPICTAIGYGLKISVQRGHLTVHDGICDQRQTRRYHRATSKLKRLIVIGHTGYITLEALRWLYDTGAAFVQINSDGQLLTTSTTAGPAHSALRRAQALANTSPTGVEIARTLLHTKVAGQQSLLAEVDCGDRAKGAIDNCLRDISDAQGLAPLMRAEAQAASAYWGAWAALPIRISGRPAHQLPDHWKTFGQRHSLLTGSPRSACNPPNAILNYLYALLEAETTIACHTVGLDPLLGIFHADQRNRPSLALDAMEPIRPIVDAYVLAMLSQRTLSRDDFAETRQGTCRLTPKLAARLAETSTTWRHHVGPVVEGIAQAFAASTARPMTISAPLTRAQHQAAWNDRAPTHKRREAPVSTPTLPNACRDCGTHLPDSRRHYCERCRQRRWSENASQGRDTAATVLARLRAERHDPAHGGRAAWIRGAKNAAHQRAARDWTGEVPDPSVFRDEILPGLRDKPISQLVAATGLSEHYCSLIRLGKRVPHPRHWDALRHPTGRAEAEI